MNNSSARTGNELLHFESRSRANHNDFDTRPTVILIHGFTESWTKFDSSISLGPQLTNIGANVFCYNYDSYNGINRAAIELAELLVHFNILSKGAIEKNQPVLISHSMGGLVARTIVQLTEAGKYISAIVTFGTPHSGAFVTNRLLSTIVRFIEFSTMGYNGFHPKCVSAKELMGIDNEDCIPLLTHLSTNTKALEKTKVLSISGGKKFLEFGSNPGVNFLANSIIQKNIGNFDNDGLVPEYSSDIKKIISNTNENLHHNNNYSGYEQVNHTHMTEHQVILNSTLVWLQKNIWRGETSDENSEMASAESTR